MIQRPRILASGLTLAGVIAGPVLAATVTSSSFNLDGAAPALTLPGGAAPVFADWNPRPNGNNHIHVPGFHVSFYGTAGGCDPAAINGPAGPLARRDALLLNAADAPFRPESGATIWSPQPDPRQCGGVNPRQAGPAFVAAGGGALDLFTSVSAQGAQGGFWQAISPHGQSGKGTNASSEGSFVSWQFDPAANVHPWAGAKPVVLRITTDEAVPTMALQSGSDPRRPTQAHQKIEVAFFNKACAAAVDNKLSCHPHIMFDIALARPAGVQWVRLRFANYAHVVVDRAQGGLAIVEGPLAEAGGTTSADAGGEALWRSTGAATQRESFGRQTFGVEMSFDQFKKCLGLIALRVAQSSDDGADANQMSQMFGAQWNAPQAWIINQVLIGQEVHVGTSDASGYIGGRVFNVYIGP